MQVHRNTSIQNVPSKIDHKDIKTKSPFIDDESSNDPNKTLYHIRLNNILNGNICRYWLEKSNDCCITVFNSPNNMLTHNKNLKNDQAFTPAVIRDYNEPTKETKTPNSPAITNSSAMQICL
jgi:hypothetical protein